MKNQAFIKMVGEADTAYADLDTFGVTLIKGWREALLTPTSVKSYVTMIADWNMAKVLLQQRSMQRKQNVM